MSIEKEIIGDATIYHSDCMEVLESIENIDSCVADPPYGLSFMGKQWDYDVPQKELWEKVYQSIKQGGHLLSFFGSRTYHRGVIPIEDAGFEIRDQLMWLYGSGFPKSHNIGKAVDKRLGNEREVVGVQQHPTSKDRTGNKSPYQAEDSHLDATHEITKGKSEYEGWGTALKPAHEPIVMARKPFKGSVADNVLEHGTGGINIDSCRVGDEILKEQKAGQAKLGTFERKNMITPNRVGRFPANVMHDGSEVVQDVFGDKSRYFYCAKASKKDREDGNNHPTVKPTELMRYLCRLVTPKGGVVLDPFMGSGSTGKGALLEGFKFTGIEMEREYFDIACARLEDVQKNMQVSLFDEH